MISGSSPNGVTKRELAVLENLDTKLVRTIIA
jgi:hypothetical protein